MQKLLTLGWLSLTVPLAAAAQHALPSASFASAGAHSSATVGSARPSGSPVRPVPTHSGVSSRPVTRSSPQARVRTVRPVGTSHPAASIPSPGPALVATSGSASWPYNQVPEWGGGYPVPGLGFDFEHFFAVHPNWGQLHPVGGIVFPFYSGGFYLPVPYYPEPAPEEQAAGSMEEAPAVANAEPPSEEPTEPGAARSNAPSSTLPVEEFVFVERDGTVVYAVAYSWLNNKLQYVSREGVRRVLALDQLDLDATEKSNQDRGNTITLPELPASHIARALQETSFSQPGA